jgi:hypothetical protein
MHPNLAQAIAAERRADLRRAADAYRRARDYPAAGDTAGSADVGQRRAGRNSARSSRQGRIHLVPSQRRQAAVDGTARRNGAYRSADEMLVLPDGTTERAESADLCSAGR